MSNPKIEAAKAYLERGWRPLQLHGVNAVTGEGCTCRKGKDCRSTGKHPVEDGWQKAEPLTVEGIEAAWAGWRSSHNVGIATGAASGFFVLDVDPDNGGTESLKQLQLDYKPLEVAVASQTGSGGWHLLFAMPQGWEPTNRRGGLKGYPGLDIRGTGGQIVAPPSSTPKGDYRWLKEGEPEPAPEWLLALLRPESPKTSPQAASAPAGPPPGDPETERVAAYATTVRDLEVGRLTAMTAAAVPQGQTYTGEPWDQTTFHVACALLELANSDWAPYTTEQAYADLHRHAPRDDGFTDLDVNRRWESAVATVGDKARPYPVARVSTADEVASWMTEPGVRVDPLLRAPAGAVVAPDPDFVAPADKPMRSWDDLGNAMRVVDHFGKGLRWIHEAEQWTLFRDGRWELVRPPVVQGLIQRMFDEVVPATEALHYSDIPTDPDAPEDTERAGFLKWLKAQRMSARISAAQKEAQGRHELHASLADFDQHPMLLNVKNGIVDLATGKLLKADPKLLLMRQVQVEYDPNALAPMWDTFLERVQPNVEMRAYLQRVLGYSATGSTREQSFFIWHGDGANGKSVCSGVVGHILGEYGQVVAPSTLLSNAQDEHPAGIMMMMGKRWLPATETAPGKRLDEEKVKNLTGGEPVAARAMGKDWVEFIPTGKIHLITNHLPFLSDAKSIWRRIHLIRWGVSIPDSEVDRMLESKLRAEAQGILAWIVRGAVAWNELEGLAPPQVALDDLAEYRGDSDAFGDFLRERTMPAPGAKATTQELYRSYQNWAFDQGIRKPMTQQSFVATMLERKFKRFRDSRSRGFENVIVINLGAQAEKLPWDA